MSNPTTDPRSIEQRIVENIIDNLTDRKGLRHAWDNIDADMQDEISAAWQGIVHAELVSLRSSGGARAALNELHQIDREIFSPEPAGGQWQPIGTAPSDTAVLVSGFATEAYTELPTDKRWLVVAVKLGGHWYRSYTDGSQNGAELLPPTHWMRKPEDPS